MVCSPAQCLGAKYGDSLLLQQIQLLAALAALSSLKVSTLANALENAGGVMSAVCRREEFVIV